MFSERKISMSNGLGFRLIICISLISFSLFFFGGCAPQQQKTAKPVDLYVDAVMLSELNENEQAVEKLNTAVKTDQNFSLAYSLMGDIYQKMQDYENSATAYERAAQINPYSFKDYFNLGKVYYVMEKFANAVRAYVKAVELEPNDLEANVGAAKSYYKVKDYNNALAYGERAQQIDPNINELQKMLGDIYETRKNYDQAIAAYKRALEADSNNPEIMVSLAVAYLRTNRNEPAKELLLSAIQLQPTNDAYKYLGFSYLRLYEQASKEYMRLLKAEPNDIEKHNSMKDATVALVEDSIEAYKKAIEINEKDWDAHRGLGVAYMIKSTNTKDDTLKAKALEEWRLSLEAKPDQPNAKGLQKLIQKYSK